MDNQKNKLAFGIVVLAIIGLIIYVVSGLVGGSNNNNNHYTNNSNSNISNETVMYPLQEGVIDNPGGVQGGIDAFDPSEYDQNIYSLKDVESVKSELLDAVLDKLYASGNGDEGTSIDLEYEGSQISETIGNPGHTDLWTVYRLKYYIDNAEDGKHTDSDTEPIYVIVQFSNIRITPDGNFEYDGFSLYGNNGGGTWLWNAIYLGSYLLDTSWSGSVYDYLPREYYDSDLNL